MMSFRKFVLLSISSVALLLLGASQATALNSLELGQATQDGDHLNISLMMNFEDRTNGGGLEILFDSSVFSFVSFDFDSGFSGFPGFSSVNHLAENEISVSFGFFTFAPPYGWMGAQTVGALTLKALSTTGVGTTSTVTTAASALIPGPFYGAVNGQSIQLDVAYGSTEVTVASPVVPEPSTALLLLVGLAGLSYRPVRKE